MGNLYINGLTQLNGTDPTKYPNTQRNYTVRPLKEDVTLEQIKKATQNNNNDEIVVQLPSGGKYIAYSDELNVESGKMPSVGDKVFLDFVGDKAEVIHAEDAPNENNRRFFQSIQLIAHAPKPISVATDDSKIQAISLAPISKAVVLLESHAQSDEFSWAQKYKTQLKDPHFKPTENDQKRFARLEKYLSQPVSEAEKHFQKSYGAGQLPETPENVGKFHLFTARMQFQGIPIF